MGQFSWLDCKSGEQIIDDKIKDVYLLIPKEFGGGHIKETCYDGYGNFGGYDVYDLVATWNRKALADKPNFIFPYAVYRAKYISENYKWDSEYSERIDIQLRNKKWYEAYSNLELTDEEVVKVNKEKFGNWRSEWRSIGIDLACYDEDNEALPFPIKITYDEKAIYENCAPSKSDPNQGWECEDEDEWEDEDYDGWC
jgi:hypothetical protein